MMTTNSFDGATARLGYWDEADGIEEPKPLKIVIVGAGIGGLAVAIGLRRAGHIVSVSFDVKDDSVLVLMPHGCTNNPNLHPK